MEPVREFLSPSASKELSVQEVFLIHMCKHILQKRKILHVARFYPDYEIPERSL